MAEEKERGTEANGGKGAGEEERTRKGGRCDAPGSAPGAGGADVGAFVLHLLANLAGELALLFDALLLLAAQFGDDALFLFFGWGEAEAFEESFALFDEVFAALAEFTFHPLHAGGRRRGRRGGRGLRR